MHRQNRLKRPPCQKAHSVPPVVTVSHRVRYSATNAERRSRHPEKNCPQNPSSRRHRNRQSCHRQHLKSRLVLRERLLRAPLISQQYRQHNSNAKSARLKTSYDQLNLSLKDLSRGASQHRLYNQRQQPLRVPRRKNLPLSRSLSRKLRFLL